MKNVFQQVTLASAAVSKGYQYHNYFLRSLGVAWFFIVYSLSKKKAVLQFKKFFINPSAEVARKIWNIQDTTVLSFFVQLSFPPVEFRRTLYLKKLDRNLTFDLIAYYLQSFKNNQFPEPYTYSEEFKTDGKKLLKHVPKNKIKGKNILET